MKHVEQMLQKARMKEEEDKDAVENRSEFLNKQELEDDEQMKLILAEQERILGKARKEGYLG